MSEKEREEPYNNIWVFSLLAFKPVYMCFWICFVIFSLEERNFISDQDFQFYLITFLKIFPIKTTIAYARNTLQQKYKMRVPKDSSIP